MGLFDWCSRRAGGLSIVVLVALCYWVISKETKIQRHELRIEIPGEPQASSYGVTTIGGAGVWADIFAYYTLLIHVLCFAFPIRACVAVLGLTKTLKQANRFNMVADYKRSMLARRNSSGSLASSETLVSENHDSYASSATGEMEDVELDQLATPEKLGDSEVVHAIVIPNYKEELDTLRETLEVLASHAQASTSYDVYLGMEVREAYGESKAVTLVQAFAKKFRSINYTLHPSDIPGEAAGKGSNMAWAARKLSAKYSSAIRKDVIVTGIDADSHLSANYFDLITNMHLACPESAPTTMYSAPIIFDRNAHNVPAIVRMADLLWSAAGMSGLYQGSTIAPPTSVYSLPLQLIDRVGGWDSDREAIGEDLHMYLKCFFALNGNLTSRTVLAPVSQSNITSGAAGGIRGAVTDLRARYKQSLRHMWGALDSGYALRQAALMWKERKHTSRAYRPLHRAEGPNSEFYFPEAQLNDDGLDVSTESGVFSDVVQDTLEGPHWVRLIYLFHRLFEAHFLPVHMTIVVVASALFKFISDSHGDPHNFDWIWDICNVCRISGFTLVSFYIFLYESMHRVAVNAREREMTAAGLDKDMHFSRRTLRGNLIDYFLPPIIGPFFGALPLIHAELCHFWTLDLVYTVSKKVTRIKETSVAAVPDDMV